MVMSSEEIMRNAQAAAEPGSMKNLGTSEVGAVKLNTLQSAGWVYVWDTRTGERSICNRNMLAKQLQKKRPDGSLVFTTVEPDIKPFRGALKCMLHAEGPDRKHYDEIGLPVCRKSNITSPYQVERHMQKRHPAEWAVIKAEKAEKEKTEDRAFQRAVLGMAKGEKKVETVAPVIETEEPPLYVSDNPKKTRKTEK